MQHGLSKSVAVTVDHFSSVANLIKRSDLICVLPNSAIAKEIITGETVATMTPIEIMWQHISTIWHKRQDRDQGLIWFEEHFNRLLIVVENDSKMCQSQK